MIECVNIFIKRKTEIHLELYTCRSARAEIIRTQNPLQSAKSASSAIICDSDISILNPMETKVGGHCDIQNATDSPPSIPVCPPQ